MTTQEGTPLAQQLALGAKLGEKELSSWKPWQLLKTIGGNAIQPAVKGIAIGIGPDPIMDNSILRLRANIDLG